MGEKLSKRLTIPITERMMEQVEREAACLNVRPVDIGRMALVNYLNRRENELNTQTEWDTRMEAYSKIDP
jgi:hypothetical protein